MDFFSHLACWCRCPVSSSSWRRPKITGQETRMRLRTGSSPTVGQTNPSSFQPAPDEANQPSILFVGMVRRASLARLGLRPPVLVSRRPPDSGLSRGCRRRRRRSSSLCSCLSFVLRAFAPFIRPIRPRRRQPGRRQRHPRAGQAENKVKEREKERIGRAKGDGRKPGQNLSHQRQLD